MGNTRSSCLLVLLCATSGFLPPGAAMAGQLDAIRNQDNLRSAYPLRQHLLDAGIDACEEIDKESYVTGLLFNGPGMHTYYQQAYCFLELAVRERAPDLCLRVRKRGSLFFDGSGVSQAVCETRVAAAIEDDKQKARGLAEARGRVIESVEVIGIVEYDAVTSARSLILRAQCKPPPWAYYRYEFELVDTGGRVLGRLQASPHGVNAADRLFLFSFTTLEQVLGGAGLESISAIVLRARLSNQADSAPVMAHLDFDQLDMLEIGDSGFAQIPMLGSIEHARWLELVNYGSDDTEGFLAQLDSLLHSESLKREKLSREN